MRAGEKRDQYVFVAIDAETKLVPAFLIGERDLRSTTAFMEDLAKRISSHFQLSTDSFKPYNLAVPKS